MPSKTVARQKSPTQIYDQHQRMYRRLMRLEHRNALRAHPETGGHSLLVHNWGNDAAKAAVARSYARAATMYAVYKRLYNAAEHRQHIARNEAGQYLWCDACQAVR